MEPRTAGRAVCRQEHRRYAPGARLALSGGGHVPDRLDLAVDLRPETPAQPAVPLRGGQRIRQMGRAGPAAGAGGALCAQAHSGPLRQGAGRPVQARAAAAAPRGGDQGPRSAAQPETMAEQQAQAVLFGTDGHPAHLHRGALGRGRHGDDLRRDHRGDAQRRACPTRPGWTLRRSCATPIW